MLMDLTSTQLTFLRTYVSLPELDLSEQANRLGLQPASYKRSLYEIRGIVEFEDSAMRFRTTTRVGPGQHFPVATRLREIIRECFSAAGITVPYEQQRVTLNESGNPANGGG